MNNPDSSQFAITIFVIFLLINIAGAINIEIVNKRTLKHSLESIEWRYQYRIKSIERLSKNMTASRNEMMKLDSIYNEKLK